MYLDEYESKSVREFNGLFDRGPLDIVPEDHATDLQNVIFTKTGQVRTRPACRISKATGRAVVRQFLATFTNSTSILLTCDGAGKIYREDTGATLLTVTNMIDFAAINMFNFVIIAPIVSSYSATNYVHIWDGTHDPRPLAGFAPTDSMTGAESATAGNITAGVHKFAVCYYTETGFTTQPGPKIADVFTPLEVTATGGFKIDLSDIPTGPTGTMKRVILATKADLDEYFFIPDGTIEDNTTTTLTVDFRDTDLAVSADYLFDLREYIISGFGAFGGMCLQKYHESLLIAGAEADLVRVSNSGDCESFSDVTGYIQLPTENDGNTVRAMCSRFDTLYLIKPVGIFSTQDNDSGDPSSWKVIQIDGGAGAWNFSLSSITGSQTSLSQNSVFLLASREGVFRFAGSVERPELTWKIKATWDRITKGYDNYICAVQDVFFDIFYFLVPLDGATTPNTLLVMDFTNGMDAEKVQWSKFTFAFTPLSVSMINFNDGDDFNYYLRIGSATNLYKLKYTDGNDEGNEPIDSYYQTCMVGNGDFGVMNVFSNVRYSVSGSGTLTLKLYDKDNNQVGTGPNTTLTTDPAKDYLKKINNVRERIAVRVGTASGYFLLNRIDTFYKKWYAARPY